MPGELQGLRVLLVEDEYLVAMNIELMLRQCGCAVVGPIGDLASALRVAQEGGFDLALLDVNVGGEHVTAVAEALQKQAVPMVFCTGYQTDNLPARFAGAPTLKKPFQAGDVVAAVRAATRDEGTP